MSRLRLFAMPSGVALLCRRPASCGGHSRSLPVVGVGLIAALLASALPAQTRTHAVPKAVSGVFAGGHAAFFPGVPPTTTIQSWFTGRDVPSFPITAGSLRGDSAIVNPSASITLELTYISSPVTFAQFSPTLANNRAGTAVTVLPQTSISLPATTPGDGPNGGNNWWLPFVAPFVFTGPNLVTQTRIFSVTTSTNGPAFVDSYVQQAPTQHYSVGRSCGGFSSLAASHDGVNFGLLAEGVPPTDVVAFLLGQENLALGNTRLPLDLSSLGMTVSVRWTRRFAA